MTDTRKPDPTEESLIAAVLRNGRVSYLLEIEMRCAHAGLVPGYTNPDSVLNLLDFCAAILDDSDEAHLTTEVALEIASHRGLPPAVRRAALRSLSPVMRLQFAAELQLPCPVGCCAGHPDAYGDDVAASQIVQALTEDVADDALIALVCRLRPRALVMLDALTDIEHPEPWQLRLASIVAPLMTPGVSLAGLAWLEAQSNGDRRRLVRIAANPYHPFAEHAAAELERQFGIAGIAASIPPGLLHDALDAEVNGLFGESGDLDDRDIALHETLTLHLLWASGLAEQLVMGGEIGDCARDLVTLDRALRVDRDGMARAAFGGIGDGEAFTTGSRELQLTAFESSARELLPCLEPVKHRELPVLPASSMFAEEIRPMVSVLSFPFPVLVEVAGPELVADAVATVCNACGYQLEMMLPVLDRLLARAAQFPLIELLELADCYTVLTTR